jgi:hypothetical protein
MSSHFDRIVMCKDGHLFTTIWMPFGSLKAVRFGDRRWQHCPVGRHWSMVDPGDPDGLTEGERAEATATHDIHVF